MMVFVAPRFVRFMFVMIFPVSMIAIGPPAHAKIINDPSWCGNTATNCVPIPHKPKCVRPSETRVSPGDSSYTRTLACVRLLALMQIGCSSVARVKIGSAVPQFMWGIAMVTLLCMRTM